ncbi:hypothetical protein H0920_00750 [Acinetobacter sp. C_4_1]|uniref:hypothetical protein n=1 Tax=unclassified Acinetobacter TaxID=196816 RepID=UPI0021B84CEE|nr:MULTISPECIES: hypothetical protein [unclassified Acinetobacter]MCT8088624.1 hypothetical protein [Acinetobacter sp. F_3_1]MCT8096780.1 hypothetical protein [Acinetobacter sp. C_3_1]MCT8099655.1 hypothetical protein [Acinetobacter sp. C_4_1]MCT8133623.1 hypothetical protein [Acinetobacter sp. T_3_1]
MKRDFIPAVLLTLISISIPSYTFAHSLYSTYIIMGGGMLVVFVLAIYVFYAIRKSIQLHINKPTK